jgi:hypothetical protein
MGKPHPALTPMDVARYYMSRLAMHVEAEHFQELCRTVAYAIDPAQTAYRLVLEYGLTHLLSPEDIERSGQLPHHTK